MRCFQILRQGIIGIAACLLCTLTAHAGTPSPRPLTVFAAASLQESLDEATVAYTRATRQKVRVSYAGSSALARQIEQGAPADVFISADRDWMDYLQQRELVDIKTRHDLLGNSLVLVAPFSGKTRPLTLKPSVQLLPLLDGGRLAVGLTASVPAGKYARASLASLGMWRSLQPHLAEAENVRAALMLVARGEAPLGIVYASDALAEPRVRVLATFPEASHPPIVYPVARVATSRHPGATALVQWLQAPGAKAIFIRHGFSAP